MGSLQMDNGPLKELLSRPMIGKYVTQELILWEKSGRCPNFGIICEKSIVLYYLEINFMFYYLHSFESSDSIGYFF